MGEAHWKDLTNKNANDPTHLGEREPSTPKGKHSSKRGIHGPSEKKIAIKAINLSTRKGGCNFTIIKGKPSKRRQTIWSRLLEFPLTLERESGENTPKDKQRSILWTNPNPEFSDWSERKKKCPV